MITFLKYFFIIIFSTKLNSIFFRYCSFLLSTILGLHLGQSGIFFINVAYLIFHSCSQILHCNLIGELVFMKDTKDKSEGDKYFCISAIFLALFSARFSFCPILKNQVFQYGYQQKKYGKLFF